MCSKQQLFLLVLGLVLTYIYAASPVQRRTRSSTVGDSETQSEIIQSVQKGVASFAEKLNKQLFNETKENGNILVSPLNIYAALASLHLGADGKTKEELSSVLGLPSNNEKLLEAHQEFGNLLKSLQNVTQYNEIRFGNGVFLQKGEQLKPSYVLQAKSYYDNEVSTVDFKNEGQSSTDTINNWISEKTKGRIPKLFELPLNPDTKLILAATLYFNAKWEEPFYVQQTKIEKFSIDSGGEVDANMMTQTSYFAYSKNARLQIESLSIPYGGDDYAMLIILPNVNQKLKDLVNKLTNEDYQQVIKNTSQLTYVGVKIPRLKFKWQKSINEQIKQLGIKDIFQKANLGNMILNQNLAVSEVTHSTEIEVHESGTVASAATVVVVNGTLAAYKPKPQPIKFYVNRPFLFLIYDHETNLILFTGLVQKPNNAN